MFGVVFSLNKSSSAISASLTPHDTSSLCAMYIDYTVMINLTYNAMLRFCKSHPHILYVLYKFEPKLTMLLQVTSNPSGLGPVRYQSAGSFRFAVKWGGPQNESKGCRQVYPSIMASIHSHFEQCLTTERIKRDSFYNCRYPPERLRIQSRNMLNVSCKLSLQQLKPFGGRFVDWS